MWSRVAVAVLLLCLMAPGALADTVNMSISWGSNGYGDIYGPYTGHISSIDNNSTSIDVLVMCLDYSLPTNVGQIYTYDRTFNAGPGVAPPTTLATQEMYDLAAKLFATYGSNAAERVHMNNAIWSIFDASRIDDGGLIPLVAGVAAPNYAIYTPSVTDGAVHNQRFLSVGVPDGGMTLMLLGGALVGLESLRRKLRA